ncbi:phosphodiesterase [Acidiphilium sp.]|uniref:phosphodiesterase n=1 Tax=Acidiphilium sp. TaxID=527 RepID=UPI003D01BCCD
MLIAHLSDLHIRPFGLPANRVVETNMMAERAVRQLARLAPAAVVITGDLTDSGEIEEYAELRRLLEGRLGCPIYVVPGNHDHRGHCRTALATWPGVTCDPAFVQYTADIGDLRLIMLDSVVPGAGHGELCPRRLAFLEAALMAAADRPVLIGLHHPPLMTGIAAMDAIALRAPEAFLALVGRHSQVKAVLCGHHHRVIIGQHGGAMLLAAPAVGGHQSELTFEADARAYFHLEPGGYFVLRWDRPQGLTATLATIGDFPGPFPFTVEPGYPGRPADQVG